MAITEADRVRIDDFVRRLERGQHPPTSEIASIMGILVAELRMLEAENEAFRTAARPVDYR